MLSKSLFFFSFSCSSFIWSSLSLAASIAFFLLSICSSEKTFLLFSLLISILLMSFSFSVFEILFLFGSIIFFLFVSIKTYFDLPWERFILTEPPVPRKLSVFGLEFFLSFSVILNNNLFNSLINFLSFVADNYQKLSN